MAFTSEDGHKNVTLNQTYIQNMHPTYLTSKLVHDQTGQSEKLSGKLNHV